MIEDDADDQEMFQQALAALNISNKLKVYTNCTDALNYLMDTQDKPFLIISDINVPGMNGLEMRRKVNESARLRKKSIPFVFLSTSSKQQSVELAYELQVQGYFQKPNSTKAFRELVGMVMDYWKICIHPNIS